MYSIVKAEKWYNGKLAINKWYWQNGGKGGKFIIEIHKVHEQNHE